ncbi:hypothetical protein BDZ94DRAFT_1240667 [Collybia nuda]|uniref:Uncharacterized protein n=1 Tax=Collybia nuda TaxID=64659 RepID=A0A9P5XW16_9AGAR|nr:hypothetical protein BDZ94DRAFT_1240667 [Collybia nuda]
MACYISCEWLWFFKFFEPTKAQCGLIVLQEAQLKFGLICATGNKCGWFCTCAFVGLTYNGLVCAAACIKFQTSSYIHTTCLDFLWVMEHVKHVLLTQPRLGPDDFCLSDQTNLGLKETIILERQNYLVEYVICLDELGQ